MPDLSPPDVRALLGRVMDASPADIKLMTQRLRDHVFEPRMSAAETRALVRELGHQDIHALCSAAGLSPHIAERWDRFGISGEMQKILLFMLGEKQRVTEAIQEFEQITHVGIDEFLRERKLL